MNAHNPMVISQLFIQQWLNLMHPVTSGAGGMHQEHIHSTPIWQGAAPCYDTVFVETDPELPGMRGMTIGCVFHFISFTFQDVHYPYALIHWYSTIGTEPDEDTGLWVVKPEFKTSGCHSLAIIHLDCIA